MLAPKLEDLCHRIFKLDRQIRYAAVLDRQGRVLAGGMRKGYRALEPKTEELRLTAHITSQMQTNDTWDQYFGRTIFSFTKRENVSLLLLPHREKLIFVSAEPALPMEQVANIREMVLNFLP
jgi:hypothetical protein